jgi:hypothetical protein
LGKIGVPELVIFIVIVAIAIWFTRDRTRRE